MGCIILLTLSDSNWLRGGLVTANLSLQGFQLFVKIARFMS